MRRERERLRVELARAHTELNEARGALARLQGREQVS